jgi:hypothetical protein
MHSLRTSRIMPRTTLDIDPEVLKELKQLRAAEGRSLGDIASELLASALHDRAEGSLSRSFEWVSKPMRAKVDIRDKEAVYRAMEDR